MGVLASLPEHVSYEIGSSVLLVILLYSLLLFVFEVCVSNFNAVRRYISMHSALDTRHRWVLSFCPWYVLSLRLVRYQLRSERCAEEKNL
jgi:hypothetical protein